MMGIEIIIKLHDEKDGPLNKFNELNSGDLCVSYSSIDNCGYGLQSNYTQSDKKYEQQLELCSQIIRLSKKLKEVSK